MRTILLIAFAVALACTAPALAADPPLTLLDLEIKKLEDECKALRVQIAQAKLKVSELESRLKDAPSGTVVTRPGSQDDEDVDDTGAAKAVRTWKVRVQGRRTLDTGDIDKQIQLEEGNLSATRKQIAEAKWRLGVGPYPYVVEPGYYTPRVRTLKDDETGALRADLKRMEARERAGRIRINTLQQQKTDAGKIIVVDAVDMANNQVIRILDKRDARGLVESLQNGKVYNVEGRRSGGDRIIADKVSAVE